MKIGFYIKWPKGTFNSKGINVIGDELYGESMCKALAGIDPVDEAQLYAPNYLPKEKLDVLVYLNDTEPQKELAAKHVLYLQNAYGHGSENALKVLQKNCYDGYAFISQKLLEIHQQDGHQGIFLPFGVNTGLFYPRDVSPEYGYDVAYIGNDIKGESRTTRYLLPAARYNFGLFGNWDAPEKGLQDKLIFWKNNVPKYKYTMSKLSKGKIPQEDVPVLYSSVKINLNCTAQDCVDWDVVTLRTFEVLACQGFLISDKVRVAEKELDGCLVFTEGGQDLVEKIDYYLSHEQERKSIARKGYEYVIRHATIQQRMKELVNYLNVIV